MAHDIIQSFIYVLGQIFMNFPPCLLCKLTYIFVAVYFWGFTKNADFHILHLKRAHKYRDIIYVDH